MDRNQIFFETSPWLIILCLLLGAGYAYFLYQNKGPWSKRTNYVLALLRFCLASLIAILILGPLLEQVKNAYVPPTYVIAVDNSLSIPASVDSMEALQLMEKVADLRNKLKDKDYEVFVRSFSGTIDELDLSEVDFSHPSSNLHQLLQSIRSDYEGKNLAGVVLLSDGIYNRGASPEYARYEYPIYTLGLGDTIPKKDINLNALYYNKVSYQGNKFPLVAEIDQNGFTGTSLEVTVQKDGQTLQRKMITLEDNLQQVDFELEANDIGLQHYIVRVDTLGDEFTHVNNLGHAYIDIVEGKEKILLAAASPHPDIKALLSALEKNQNYEVTLYIPGIQEIPAATLASPDFNAIILHQIPSKAAVNLPTSINALIEKGISTWYILGDQSNLIAFNNENTTLSIQQMVDENDQVLPQLAPNFKLFKFNEAFYEALSWFPQVSVPYGEYSLKGSTETVLLQKVGNIATGKPLLVIGSSQNVKTAVLAGEGIWKWRLQEYAESGSGEGFDGFVSKIVQYLSSKEDRRRFKVYPLKNEFIDHEPVIFDSEIYNDIFDPVYNQTIELEITNEEGNSENYQFTTNPSNTRYHITGLDEGIYQYRAVAALDGKKYSTEGEFSIKKLQLENLNLTANHGLLKKVSGNSRGEFFHPSEFNSLEERLLQKEVKSIIYSDEQFLPVINLWWFFVLLILLISVEWFLRKYNGSY